MGIEQIRTPLIAGNWKMHKTGVEAVEAAHALRNHIKSVHGVEVMIAPPFTSLAMVSEALKGSQVAVGAQNMYWVPEGAYTGEISPQMLISAGCRYVIIGHSERRQLFAETDSDIQKKVAAALQTGLAPILCIGETEAEREAGKTFSILDKQLENGLRGFVSADMQTVTIAYEPVCAIGTVKTATSEQAQEVHAHIRVNLGRLFGDSHANTCRILYGGSVKPGNIAELMSMPDVDGALVGGASLDPETFARIVCYQ